MPQICLWCLYFLFTISPCALDAMIERREHKVEAVYCSPELKASWKKILSLPEAQRLVASVQKGGSIRIHANNQHHLSQRFGAFWDPCSRVITIDSSSERSEGALIASIIFELHNAYKNSELINLDHQAAAGIIDRESYVKGVEMIEYQNSIRASELTLKGVERGVYPESALLRTYATFDEHYRIQQAGGHSSNIAKNYAKLARGTKVRYLRKAHPSTCRPARIDYKRASN